MKQKEADHRSPKEERQVARVDSRARWVVPVLLVGWGLMATMLLVGPAASLPERPSPAASGGGEYVLPTGDHISDAERARIETMIRANGDRLAAEGRLPAPRAADRAALDWPLAGRDGFTDPGYHAVTGFVDHSPGFPGQVLDYACGGRTYDTASGYNHKGTDFYLWPFAWNKMAAGDIVAVAAAPGVIIGRDDGNSDQSCSFNSNRWNAVYVRHDDGSVAWYGHLKRGSVTSKSVGATVAAGEYLGVVGSSGNSTGPHLHFELYDAGRLVDPYAGSCNQLDGGSWWASQRNYFDSAVNRLATGTAAVTWGSCPNPDTPNEATQFQPGDRITFTAYYRDQLDSQPALYRVVAPDGTIYAQWSHTNPKPHYTLSYWWWAYDFPVSVQTGTWSFEVEFNGQTYRHAFYVGQPSTAVPTVTPSATPTLTPPPVTDPSATPSVTPSTTPSATPPSEPTSTRAAAADRQNFIPFMVGDEAAGGAGQ